MLNFFDSPSLIFLSSGATLQAKLKKNRWDKSHEPRNE